MTRERTPEFPASKLGGFNRSIYPATLSRLATAFGEVTRVAEPTEPEITFLLNTLNGVLQTPVHRSQVLGTFAGLRPLFDGGGGSTADVSRRHLVATSDDGFVSVLGGKLTTYRRMAEDAVDQALRTRGLTAPHCFAAARGFRLGRPHSPAA